MHGNRNVLISGAGFAGLASAFWMRQLGYDVTVVEITPRLKKGGTPVNIRDNTIDILKRMGLFDQVFQNRLSMGVMEFKNANDVTEHTSFERVENDALENGEFEIERDALLDILFKAVKDDVEVLFDDGIASLGDAENSVSVSFNRRPERSFDLVFGCDGIHSAVRRLWFGSEDLFSHFLGGYGSTTIVDTLLIPENTTQMYQEPGKLVMLNAYNGKTDIVLAFAADQELPYDYRDEAWKRKIIADQFAGVGWRTPELLRDVAASDTFYFDKLCQIKMPSWTRGRIALVGDAGYCASPAAGRGGSLAIDGAAALADALTQHGDDYPLAFAAYNHSFRPFIEEVQAEAASFSRNFLLPQTDEAIREWTSPAGAL